MSSRLLDGAPVLRRSFLGVLARVFAGIMHMLYGMLVWLSKQVLPDLCDADILERHADTWGITRIAATYATGNIDVTGTNGSVIPVGSIMARADGVEYSSTTEQTIAAGVAVVPVIALIAGVDGNAIAATVASFTSTITGVDQAGAVATGGLTGGVDQETDEDLRDRLLTRLQAIPHGGCLEDYEFWAREVAGVYIPFVFPLYDYDNDLSDQPGYVGVTCISTTGIPSAGVITALQAHLDEVAPVTADVVAYAPTPLTVNFEMNLDPNDTTTQDAVEAEIAALFEREGAPNVTIPLSHINEAISLATGENDHILTTPAADITTTKRQYPVLGTFTYHNIP
jgi:uncharacterized phage protein gp47/JayE